MGEPRRFGELEVGYDPAHEEREWIAQRVGWAIMILLLVLAALKQFFPRLELFLDGQPVIVVDKGQLVRRVMQKSRVDEEDILSAARKQQGLQRLDQIKYAILERDGTISIIARE